MCSASSLMGMGGWLIIPAWQQGSEVTQTSVEWPKLLQVGIAHMQRCENNYTDREHHTLRGSTLRQKINSDPCVRTKWGESSLLVNYFSLINCSLCDQRSNNSRENKHRQNTNYEACAHNTQHTRRKQPMPPTVISFHSRNDTDPFPSKGKWLQQ